MTLKFDNAPLDVILDYLREVSGLSFAIDTRLSDEPSGISINLRDVPLEMVLDRVCAAARRSWRIEGGMIVFPR